MEETEKGSVRAERWNLLDLRCSHGKKRLIVEEWSDQCQWALSRRERERNLRYSTEDLHRRGESDGENIAEDCFICQSVGWKSLFNGELIWSIGVQSNNRLMSGICRMLTLLIRSSIHCSFEWKTIGKHWSFPISFLIIWQMIENSSKEIIIKLHRIFPHWKSAAFFFSIPQENSSFFSFLHQFVDWWGISLMEDDKDIPMSSVGIDRHVMTCVSRRGHRDSLRDAISWCYCSSFSLCFPSADDVRRLDYSFHTCDVIEQFSYSISLSFAPALMLVRSLRLIGMFPFIPCGIFHGCASLVWVAPIYSRALVVVWTSNKRESDRRSHTPFAETKEETLLNNEIRLILDKGRGRIRTWIGPLDLFSPESPQNHSKSKKKLSWTLLKQYQNISDIIHSLYVSSSWASDVAYKYVNSPPLLWFLSHHSWTSFSHLSSFLPRSKARELRYKTWYFLGLQDHG